MNDLLRFFIIKNEYKRCAVQKNSVVSAKSTAIATTASANVSWRSSRTLNWCSCIRVSITVYLFNISLLLGNIRYKCMFLRSTLSGHGLFYHGMVTEAGESALIFISPGILPALRNVNSYRCYLPHRSRSVLPINDTPCHGIWPSKLTVPMNYQHLQ